MGMQNIGVTEPRRMAAKALAERVAFELNTPLGDTVGYQVRFRRAVSSKTKIKVMTDGILLAEWLKDPLFKHYDALMIDEAHERSLNIDLLLGALQDVIQKRDDLKVVIASATLNPGLFARYFKAPIIEIEGRAYPVDMIYEPFEDDLYEAIAKAVDRLPEVGDILVFLPGEREILEAREKLAGRFPYKEVLPLYARLAESIQRKIFAPSSKPRIILATNIAEASLTVPGVRYVIDTGLIRVKRYAPRAGIDRLLTEKTSQASSIQRAGRAGRVAPGMAIRLFEEKDFLARAPYPEAEIFRQSLAHVALFMKAKGINDIASFPFLEKPSPKAIADAIASLKELGALDENECLTETGRKLASIPADPRIARMIVAAHEYRALREMLVIASGLSVQTPWQERNPFADPRSDFLGLLKLWQAYMAVRVHSKNKAKVFCEEKGLSYDRMAAWEDVHEELKGLAKDLSLDENIEPAGYEAIHRALLTGLLRFVGKKMEEGFYLAPKGIRFYLHPFSTVKKGDWLMAAELVETKRLFARHVAVIDAKWMMDAAAHLMKKRFFDPYWSTKMEAVMAKVEYSLWGLPIMVKSASYGKENPLEARKIFIRKALVEGEWHTKALFLIHNRNILNTLVKWVDKTRRLALFDDEALFSFYDEKVGEGIADSRTFEKWRHQVESSNPHTLFLSEKDVLSAHALKAEDFPDTFTVHGEAFPLVYRFAPKEADDGVTIIVHKAKLAALDEKSLSWLVPGMRLEKVESYLKMLPKNQRRLLVPIQEHAGRLLSRLKREDGVALAEGLIKLLHEEGITDVSLDENRLEPYLQMNVRVLDPNGDILGESRNLSELKERFGVAAEITIDDRLHTSWDFGCLPEKITQKNHGILLTFFPAVADAEQGVRLVSAATAYEAKEIHSQGLARLFLLSDTAMLKGAKKNLQWPAKNMLALSRFTGLDSESLNALVLLRAAREVFAEASCRDKAQWEMLLQQKKAAFLHRTQTLYKLWQKIAEVLIAIVASLPLPKGMAATEEDIKEQLQKLFDLEALRYAPLTYFERYPHYLEAILLRLKKTQRAPQKEEINLAELKPLWQAYWKTRKPSPKDAARWALEELRIALFAQEIKTAYSISPKKFRKILEEGILT